MGLGVFSAIILSDLKTHYNNIKELDYSVKTKKHNLELEVNDKLVLPNLLHLMSCIEK